MKITQVLAVAVALAAPIVALTYASDAEACGMSMRLDPTPRKPSPVQEIARAEKALENGQNVVAAKAVFGTFPNIRTATAGVNPLETRALRVLSLAIVRSGGAVSEKAAGVAQKVEWMPNANLAWAAHAIREIDQSRPNDPSVQADLGEALAALPQSQGEALTILKTLADKDLMGSPYAYAALAKLKSSKGDSAGAEVALKRCEEMSRSPQICKPAVPAKSASPSAAAKV